MKGCETINREEESRRRKVQSRFEIMSETKYSKPNILLTFTHVTIYIPKFSTNEELTFLFNEISGGGI